MNLPEYEYRGLIAQAWDVLRGDTSKWPDRAFYLECINQFGQPVLDVGCGTGRLLLDFMQLDIDIDGVDNSPDMLALCRAKADAIGLTPRIYEQYMETLDLPRHYQTILIPSSTLQLIIEPEGVHQALRRIHDHLLPGGLVVSPFMKLWQAGEPLESDREMTAQRDSDGVQFRRISWSRYDPDNELEHTADLYQKIVTGQVVAEEKHERSPATRSYNQEQATALFSHTGFHNIQLYGEFEFTPAREEDSIFVIIAQK